MEKQQSTGYEWILVAFILLVIASLIAMIISFAHIPVNPFEGKFMTNPPYLVGEVDTGTCTNITNFDTSFIYGKDVYIILTNNTNYEMFDVDFNDDGKTGKGILHRYVLTQDPLLCEKIVAQERKKVNLN